MSVHRPNPNVTRLLRAATKLAPILDQLVFVGGAVTALLLTDPAAAPVRPTLDVDAIIALTSYAQFTILERRLLDLGFHLSQQEGAPLCRWCFEDLIVDLMPTDASILGFTNRWYESALKHSQEITIGGVKIPIVTAPYFLATKLEAFHGRGKRDFQSSHDLEDIITVIDGRSELADEVQLAESDLRQYLAHEFRALLSAPGFLEALPGYLLPDSASQGRLSLVVERMQQLGQR